MNAVQVDAISKSYRDVHALREVSFVAPAGAVYGLIGADGAGKSSLMRIITTLISPDAGKALVLGKSIAADQEIIRRSIGYMPQRFSLYQDLSVRENIAFFADIFGIRGAERNARMRELLSFAHLEQFTARRAGNLSGGMKQKLALCCALIHRPSCIILDEPTVGVDPLSRAEFWDILHMLRADGVSILISTPYMDEAAYCDRLALLHHGAVIAEGSPADLARNYPRELYRIRHYDQSVAPAPAAIPGLHTLLVYPAGGDLHIALDPATSPADATAQLERRFGRRPESITPTIEDVFIYQLSEKSS